MRLHHTLKNAIFYRGLEINNHLISIVVGSIIHCSNSKIPLSVDYAIVIHAVFVSYFNNFICKLIKIIIFCFKIIKNVRSK